MLWFRGATYTGIFAILLVVLAYLYERAAYATDNLESAIDLSRTAHALFMWAVVLVALAVLWAVRDTKTAFANLARKMPEDEEES